MCILRDRWRYSERHQPLQKKKTTFNFSMRDDVVHRKGNMKRITNDQHSLGDYHRHTGDGCFRSHWRSYALPAFMMTHWLLLLLQYIHIAFLQSFFTTHQKLLYLVNRLCWNQGENKARNSAIVILNQVGFCCHSVLNLFLKLVEKIFFRQLYFQNLTLLRTSMKLLWE